MGKFTLILNDTQMLGTSKMFQAWLAFQLKEKVEIGH